MATPSRTLLTRQVGGIGLISLGQKYGRRGYLVPAMMLTILYLVLELGFNARLLDATWSLAGETDISSIKPIEWWGRIISGLAVTLFVWHAQIMPRAWASGWTIARMGGWLALSAVLLMTAVYYGEERLIDCMVDQSTGAERRSAAQLQALSMAIAHNAMSVVGIELSAQTLCTPEGKAFLSLFSYTAISTASLQSTLASTLKEVLAADASRQETSEHVYKTEFRDSVDALRTEFQTYLAASSVPGYDSLSKDPNELWRNYIDTLQQDRHYTPDQVPTYEWRDVAEAVRKTGVPVPKNWNPQDHQAFVKAVKQAQDEATANSKATVYLPSGLGWESFVEQPSVQREWRKHLLGNEKGPDGILLRPSMSMNDFNAAIYTPFISAFVDRKLDFLSRPDEEYLDGRSHEKLGREAMEGLLVPPIALFFSIIGALLHTAKSFNYVLAVLGVSLRGWLLIGGVFLTAGCLPFLAPPNVISDSRAFHYFEAQMRARRGPPFALGIQWVVQAQPYVYPLNEYVRTSLLRGATFGYTPHSNLLKACQPAG